MIGSHELSVDADDVGQRVDQFLAAKHPDLTRSRIKGLIDLGEVRVNGQVVKPARKLRVGDRIILSVPPPLPARPEPQDLGLSILYEDPSIVVLDKRPGIVVHPAHGNPRGTLVNALLFAVKDLQGIGGEVRPGLVHRLDKDTSGCMVVAKSERALNALQRSFKAREVEKVYLALVHGAPPPTGTFDTAYGRHPRDRKRFTSRVSEGKRAVTHFKVLERFAEASLVEVTLETGRTHQIRVHLSEAGFPLLADKVYGGARREGPSASERVRQASEALGRQGLHAVRLAFPHPDDGRRIAVEARLPPDFEAALAVLRRTAKR